MANIRRARFSVQPFSQEQMQIIGEQMIEQIRGRIQSGINADDQTAKALKPGHGASGGYPGRKLRKGLQAIRDWTFRGKTLRSMVVKSAVSDRVAIGFADEESDRIAHANNRIERMFGVSPKDREKLVALVKAIASRTKVIRVRGDM